MRLDEPLGTYDNIKISTEEEMIILGGRLARLLRAGDVVLLIGEMGAGKSVLARAIGRALGVEGAMPSPTYTLVLPYISARPPLYHFDLFRLEDEDEFFQAGLAEYIESDGVCLIEWPDRFMRLFEGCARKFIINIKYGESENERLVEWRLHC
jgi:tRNA threonylcarbamoyladenosine biosynthesis protein TsaE